MKKTSLAVVSRNSAIAFLCWLSVTTPQVLALDARQVFEAVSPSTVQIRTLDSGGSGVMITDRGLILTNYHVVASNIDLKITAKVRIAGKVVSKEISDVKITKVHPDYDLALLEAKAPVGAVFLPARIIPKDVSLAPGGRCFAIGNPGGPGGGALELSITEGIISSASRQIDGFGYVQFSAAINPGNSGGPVCDDQGRVFGIATWKMTESEGLGFAIPTAKISLAEFIDPKAKKPDPNLAKQAEEIGGRYNALSNVADGQDRVVLLRAAAECFRVALQAAPENPSFYTRLAVVYQKLGEIQVAKRYAEGALKLAPNDGFACHLFGEFTMKGHESDAQVVDQCIQVWLRGLTDGSDNATSGWCAEDIAFVLQKQGKTLPAAYMLRWADVLFGSGGGMRKSMRDSVWNELEKVIEENQFEAIRQKAGGFTHNEFASLSAGKPLQFAPRPSIPTITKSQIDQIVRNAAKRFAPSQVHVPADGLEIPLPDVPERAMLAYAGWKVVIMFPDLLKLGVLNLATGKMDGFIDCDDRRTLFAAGGQLVATYSPTSQILKVYDLETAKEIISRKNPRPGPIVFIGMGLLNPTRLFVLHYEKGTNGFSLFSPAFLTLPELTAVELRPTIKNGNNPLWAEVGSPDSLAEGTMDEAGRVAAMRLIGPSTTGLYQYITRESGKIEFQHTNTDFHTPGVEAGGNFVLGRGQVFEFGTDARRSNRYDDIGGRTNPYRLVPVAGYPAFAELRHERDVYFFGIFSLPAMNKLMATPLAAAVSNRLSHARAEDQKEIMLASAYCDRIAYFLPQEKRAILFPLGLKGADAGSGFAEPGKKFTKKLNLPAGGIVTLQSAPAGLHFDEKTGSLVWEVPKDVNKGQVVQVIMLVKNSDGKEEYVVEKILVP